MTAIQPYGVRIGWADLPVQVRERVEAMLGSRVVQARSQRGGFSPGTADRVVTAAGRRAFVKAVGAGLNENSPALLRREAGALQDMPESVAAPRLLAVHEDIDWVVLVLEDVEGRHPATPWVDQEVRAAISALAALSDNPAPHDWPRLDEELAGESTAWGRLLTSPPTNLDP